MLVAVLEAARAGRIDDPEHLDRFVLGTCRNVALRARDVERRAQPVEPEVLERLDRGAAPVPPPLDRDALMRCMSHLDARAQTVVHLSFYRDKTAEEIAAALATTAGNVRVIRHRAVAQLRDCLDAETA